MCRTLGASVLLLNHFLMGKEESRWQVLSPRHLKNYFITTFWPFMILIPFLGSDKRTPFRS